MQNNNQQEKVMEITIEELDEAIKMMKIDQAPGQCKVTTSKRKLWR